MKRSRLRTLSDELLSPADRQAVIKLDEELSVIRQEYDFLIFVLGNYDDGKIERLKEFQSQAHDCPSKDIGAFRMNQLLSGPDYELQGHPKFKLIADHSDAIVAIVEDGDGGVTWEQSIIRGNLRYYEKTYILKRSYPWKLDHEKYTWMQSTSLFDALENDGRLFEWTTISRYEDTVAEVLKEV